MLKLLIRVSPWELWCVCVRSNLHTSTHTHMHTLAHSIHMYIHRYTPHLAKCVVCCTRFKWNYTARNFTGIQRGILSFLGMLLKCFSVVKQCCVEELLESAALLLYANSVPALVFPLPSSADSLTLLFVAFFLLFSLLVIGKNSR